MELINEFRVAMPIDETWAVLTDIERIAPCMPGAELQAIEGDVYRGAVKVKVGPITARYQGTAAFQQKDDSARRAVVKAEGRETRGQGNAKALVTAQLSEDGEGTRVVVTTDLTISGKVAQFGRGVLSDVSSALLRQFVDRLESEVMAGRTAPSPADVATRTDELRPAVSDGSTIVSPSPSTSASPNGTSLRHIQPAPAAPVDLLGAVAVPVAKRAVPLLAVLVAGCWLLRRWTRNSRT